MRNLLLVIMLSAFTFAGCGNNSSTQNTHDHGDGASHTHENGDDHSHTDTVQQQEFIVNPDSIAHEHSDHNGDSSHNHTH